MKLAVGRMILAAFLFLGWMGYLAYLVMCRPHTPAGLLGAFEGQPLTLSRPQFLVSTLDVVAELSGDNGEKAIIKEVLFPRSNPPLKSGEEIHIENIEHCRPLADRLAKLANPPPDYNGPGPYLLALQVLDSKPAHRCEVVPTPPSPGFPLASGVRVGPPRIYPATPEMLAEYHRIAKPE